MITADQFTVNQEGIFPEESGEYILLIRTFSGKIFSVFAMYYKKQNPHFFNVYNVDALGENFTTLAWLQIEKASIMAAQLKLI